MGTQEQVKKVAMLATSLTSTSLFIFRTSESLANATLGFIAVTSAACFAHAYVRPQVRELKRIVKALQTDVSGLVRDESARYKTTKKLINRTQRTVLRRLEQVKISQLDASAKQPVASNTKEDEVERLLPRPKEEIRKGISANLTSRLTGSGPLARDVRVAMIADEFTYHSFAPEFDIVRITPANWRKAFELHQPQLFICESAWRGGDGDYRPWRGKIAASNKKKTESRKELFQIIAYCRKQGIPTVFWNKEDPMYFPDRVHDFAATAALFDFVFTTAEECVEDYSKYLGVANVEALPFAVQPRIFNPQESSHRRAKANFAGTWYQKYPERGRSASLIFDNVIESPYDLVIYDRMYGVESASYRYPERYKEYLRPSLSFSEVASSYKEALFGITLNTVTNSKTMFARRAFELAASGCVVISNQALGVQAFFGDSVIYGDSEENPLGNLTGSQLRDLQERGMSVAFRNTYRHRAEQILEATGFNFQSAEEKVVLAIRDDQLDSVSEALQNARLKNIVALAVLGEDKDPGQMAGLPVFYVSAVEHLSTRIDIPGELLNILEIPDQDVADSVLQSVDRMLLHRTHYAGAVGLASSKQERHSIALQPRTGSLLRLEDFGKVGNDEVQTFLI